jgi:hypothetical protein
MIQITRNPNGQDHYRRTCDVEGCQYSETVELWPGGSVSNGGFLSAVGHRVRNQRAHFDVCPACAEAGRLPARAENPQPSGLIRFGKPMEASTT